MENMLEIKNDLKEGLSEVKSLKFWIDNLEVNYKKLIMEFYLNELQEKTKNLNEILLRLTFNLIKE